MGTKETKIRRRRKFKLTNILILLLICGIVAFVIFRLSIKSKLKTHINAVRAAGYPVNCQELDRWYKLPDGADNAAYIILDAFSFYHKRERNELKSVPVVGQAKLPARTEPLTDESEILIEEYLADNKDALELLHEAAQIEYSRYPIDMSLGNNVSLNHIVELRFGARMLSLEAFVHADNEKSQSAVDSIKAGFGIARSLNLEPTIISQLVRISCQSLVVSALERVINRTILTDEQLLELGRIVEKTEDSEAIVRGFIGDRCFIIELLSNPELISPEIINGVSSAPLIELYSALGMTDWDTNIYLEFTNEYIESMKLPEDKRLKAVKEIVARQAKISKIHILHNELTPALSRCIEVDLRNNAHLRAAQAAVAVERYRLAKGKLPDQLSELVPEYLEVVPADPFDGNEIKYKQLSTGYVVYSIGQDLSDDGGREMPTDQRERHKNPKWDLTFIVER